ncbi:MAG: RNA polymerase sigma factor [Butyricicoccaceae bacterium]
MLDREQREAIHALYLEMYETLMKRAMVLLQNNEGLAEEAVQETFRTACTRPDAVLGSENPQGWLQVTLLGQCRNIQRSRATLMKYIVPLLSADEEMLGQNDPERVELLYGGILTPEEFRLVRLIVLEHCTHREAAEILGISEALSRKRLQRALRKLEGPAREALEL